MTLRLRVPCLRLEEKPAPLARKPFDTAAWRERMSQLMDVADSQTNSGLTALINTESNRAMALWKGL